MRNSSANWEIAAAQPTRRRQVVRPMRLGAIPLVDDPAELRPLGLRVLDSTQSLPSSPESTLESLHFITLLDLRQLCCPMKLHSFMDKSINTTLSQHLVDLRIKF
jgi:hypothetical protein